MHHDDTPTMNDTLCPERVYDHRRLQTTSLLKVLGVTPEQGYVQFISTASKSLETLSIPSKELHQKPTPEITVQPSTP